MWLERTSAVHYNYHAGVLSFIAAPIYGGPAMPTAGTATWCRFGPPTARSPTANHHGQCDHWPEHPGDHVEWRRRQCHGLASRERHRGDDGYRDGCRRDDADLFAGGWRDQGRFTINAATGALSFIAAPDFEAPGDADGNNSYIVQVRATDGTLFDTQTITVTVTDVGEIGPSASVVTVTGGVQLRPMSSNLNPRWITGAELPLLVTDADGDAPVRYRFTDVGTGSGSAVLHYGGSFQAQGTTLEVAASEIGIVYLGSGDVAGTDTLRVQVFDGTLWSAPVDITVLTSMTLNRAPVITSGGGGVNASVSVAENTITVTTVMATDRTG